MGTARTIRNTIDKTMKLAGIITAAAIVGAMIVSSTGCNTIHGMGRDTYEAATWTYHQMQVGIGQDQRAKPSDDGLTPAQRAMLSW